MPNKACGVGAITEGNRSVKIKKTAIIVFIARICSKLTKDKLKSFNSHEIRIGKGWTKKELCHFALALLR